MKTPIAVVLAGLASGGFVALVVGRAPPQQSPPPRVAEVAPPPRAPIVPPGWNRAYVDHAAPMPAQPDPEPKRAEAPREQDRADHYQRELDYRAGWLASHGDEPIDGSWSNERRAAIEGALAHRTSAGASPTVASIDCRTKTCVATLEFATPADALSYAQNAMIGVDGCNGGAIVPTPPDGAGTYRLDVMLSCR